MKHTPLSEEYLKDLAKALEVYSQFIKDFVIFEDMPRKKYDEMMDTLDKVSKRLKKGKDKDFKLEELKVAIKNGEIPQTALCCDIDELDFHDYE